MRMRQCGTVRYNIELPKFLRVCKSIEDAQGIETFAKRYRIAMDDLDLRGLYEMKLSADRDEAARLEYAEKKGREKEREDMARLMLTTEMPVDQIAKYTRLGIEQIQAL